MTGRHSRGGISHAVRAGLRPLLLAFCAAVLAATALPVAAANLAQLETAAEAGDAAAMVALGDALRDGDGVAQDQARARAWYVRADAAGDALGSFRLGELLAASGDRSALEPALQALARALARYEAALGPADLELVPVLLAMAGVQGIGADYAAALPLYRRIRDIREVALGADALATADASVDLANTLQQLRRFDEAEPHYDHALSVYRAAYGENHASVATVLMNLGAMRRKVQRFAEGIELYGRALAIFEAVGASPGRRADVHYNLCRLYMDLHLAGEALAACERALELRLVATPADDPAVAIVENMLGGALQRVGRHDEAVARLRHALDVFETRLGPDHPYTLDALSNLPIALEAAGDVAGAATLGERALTTLEAVYGPGHADVARAAVNLGTFEKALGHLDRALALALQAIAIERRPGARRSAFDAANGLLSQVLEALGRPASARLVAKEMVNRVQATRGAAGGGVAEALDRALAGRFAFLTDQLAAEGAFAEAQFVAGLMKVDELARYTHGATAAEGEHPGIRLTDGEARLAAAYGAALQPVGEILDAIDRAVAAEAGPDGPAIERLLGELPAARAASLAEVRGAFDAFDARRLEAQQERVALNAEYAEAERRRLAGYGPGVALYQAIATDGTLHLFVSAAGRETVHRTVAIDRGALAAGIFDTLVAIERRDADAAERLAALHAILIEPMAAELEAAGTQVLMLNLSGFLRYVPYAALKSDQGYLVERYALALDMPAAKTDARQPGGGATGAGFAVSAAHGAFPALPGAARELEAIFAGADGIGPLTGRTHLDAGFDLATLREALAARPRFVHVASHFAFAPGDEDRSFLLLGTGERLEAGRLRSDAALRFDGVELLVLSACETARGGGAEGEEIESFSALAQQNGAGAVMATLWRIADDSTARLTADFYRHATSGLDKARALQRAQIAMLRGDGEGGSAARAAIPIGDGVAVAADRHPFHWAAFILMGNWK
jgi:CHAT domain-containing protein